MEDEQNKYLDKLGSLRHELTDNPYFRSIDNGQKFISCLEAVASTSDITKAKMRLETLLRRKGILNPGPKQEYSLPVLPSLKVVNLDLGSLKVMDSATKPVFMRCECADSTGVVSEQRFMFKEEDIRTDQIILSLIRIMDLLLKKQNLELPIISYKAVATGSDRGMIEFVKDSITIFNINKEHGKTLQNYLNEQNPDTVINDLKSRFTKSMAAYCVVTYLLGVGDRHLENIMVTKDGTLFHIDYGYILGRDPKKGLAQTMRITAEMVDVLGGEKGEYYQMFKKLVSEAYDCLRRYAPLIMSMLSLLTKATPPIEGAFTTAELEDFIISRFRPGKNKEEATKQFLQEISRAYEDYSQHITDKMHEYGKSESLYAIKTLFSYVPSLPMNLPWLIMKK
eukprot:CAMPEP_0168539774 /NCGR_PEP_ID=MMETSP0405-20121227/22046_1 /TAXON_ID=498012 /ORGANISM="Trichosphaerium sp, Strain Am-I-7 wt" /LENGTH=394 /DNA_ID=CAMNT_0008569437 /DNA_START=857 /DNA_END=2041 /DNA_ORIENTATION=-